MERSTAPLYGSWFEWCSQLCGTNRSSSSCLPFLMFGGWKATHYLRARDPLLHFLPLKTSFENAFHTESPEHKAKGQDGSSKAPWPLCCALLWLTSVFQPDGGPVPGAGGSPGRPGLRPDQGFLECHCYHICSGSALSPCDRGMQQSHLTTPFPILLQPCDEDECGLSQVITFTCV